MEIYLGIGCSIDEKYDDVNGLDEDTKSVNGDKKERVASFD